MRLRSEADVQEFLDAVSQCGGDVYLKSPEGDIFNLKSSMSRYIAIAASSRSRAIPWSSLPTGRKTRPGSCPWWKT